MKASIIPTNSTCDTVNAHCSRSARAICRLPAACSRLSCGATLARLNQNTTRCTRGCSMVVSATAATAPAPSTSSVRVTFTVPHRVRFGQHVCIIGAGEALGEWDPVRAVGMTWTEGDIWQAEVDVEAMNELEFEYKYVVRDDNNNPVYWKPGTNCSVALPLKMDVLPESITVADDWDECVSKVEVDYPQGSQPSSNSDQTSFTYSFAEGEIYQPTEAFDFQDQEEVDDEDEEDYDDGDGDAMPQQETQSPPPPVVEPMPVVPPAAVPDADKPREMVGEQAELDELEVVAAAANRAMKNLDTTIQQSVELIDGLEDPTTEEAFAADRVVAAAARKAIALTRALNAADPSFALKAPKKNAGELPEPSNEQQ